MRPLDEHVGAHERVASAPLGDHGAVVPDPRHPLGGAETFADPADQAEFPEIGQAFHFTGFHGDKYTEIV